MIDSASATCGVLSLWSKYSLSVLTLVCEIWRILGDGLVSLDLSGETISDLGVLFIVVSLRAKRPIKPQAFVKTCWCPHRGSCEVATT